MKNRALLLAAGCVLATAALAPSTAVSHAATNPTPPPAVAPGALFSRGATRRARILLQLRLLQLREERLGCLRAILLRRLLPDMLPSDDRETGEHPIPVKQSPPPSATTLRSALGESEDCRWTPEPPRRESRTG
jgi:hypothetical protein